MKIGMFDEKALRRLILITDDEFFSDVIGTYLKRDFIAIERVSSAEAAGTSIAEGADGVLVDLATRGISADAIVTLSGRAQRWKIPMIILSAQPRRDLTEFAAVVCATDVVSKTEAMATIAARVRMLVRTPLRETGQKRARPIEQVGFAVV
jgi:DNA-binding response OmpR family regulator